MNKSCSEILLKIGMKQNLKGFTYICEAIDLIDEDVRLSDVYKEIASRHNTGSCNIEKAIRNAFESARNNLDKYELIDEYLGYDNCSNYSTLIHLKNKIKNDVKDDEYVEELREYIRMKCRIMIDEILAEVVR